MSYQGDWTEDSVHYFTFNTRKVDGTPYALAGTPSLAAYKDDGTTQSTAGLTLSVDFDSVTGLNMVKVDTSADAFYTVGHDYEVVIAAGTVNSVSVVGATVGTFSIENRFNEVSVTKWNGTAVATPDTAGYPKVTLKSGTGTGEVSLSSGAVTAGTVSDKTGYALTAAYDAAKTAAQAGNAMTLTAGERTAIKNAVEAGDFMLDVWAFCFGVVSGGNTSTLTYTRTDAKTLTLSGVGAYGDRPTQAVRA